MTEPTDAEIVALADATRTAEGGANGYILPISFCRAVLAKWGAPQPVVPVWTPASTPPKEEDDEVLVRMADGRCEIAWATYWHGSSNAFAQWTFRDPDEDEQPVEWMRIPKHCASAPHPTQTQAGAVPPEAEPIVRNCAAPGDLKPGDYVFASRWSDCDPGDPWEVGFVSEVGVYPESMTKAGYVVLQGGLRRWGRAMRITPEQGRRICEQFPSMERLPQDYDAIARVFGIKGGQHGTE